MWSRSHFFFLAGFTVLAECFTVELPKENEYPIIGVLSQEMSYNLEKLYPGMYNSYIVASYVKFMEGAGARVVPIWIGKDEAYYEDILSKLNGVILPGGETLFNVSDGYADAGEHIYKIAKKMNDAEDYFPLWGTCLGFELLTYLSANRKEHRIDCHSESQAINLEFKQDFKTSKLYGDAPDNVIKILKNKFVTSNFHQYCVTETNLTTFGIDNEWKVLSVNNDINGLTFISSIESTRYPFYGVQFHPEKNLYEWVPNKNISHTSEAIFSNRYFGDFFINEARKSQHRFKNKTEENLALIYNYDATYTGIKKGIYEQCYFFTSAQNQ